MLERRVVLSEHEVIEKVSLFSTCSSVLVGQTTRVIINISSKHLKGCYTVYIQSYFVIFILKSLVVHAI